MTPMTEKVLRFMQRYGSITRREADQILRCGSLSRRICDLKAIGYQIDTVTEKDRFNHRYTRYFLRERRAA